MKIKPGGKSFMIEIDAYKGPLSHIRVVDLTQTLAGPLTTTILGDLGAEVIKVERPRFGDQTRHFAPFKEGESHYYLSVNRNKKSIEIDLKNEIGKQILEDLIKESDVLVENFRPGVLEKLGFGKQAIQSINPNMITCSISAFGSTGPYAKEAGYDIIVQALSGVMSVTGDNGVPLRSGLPIGDIIGGLFGTISILGAIIEKERTNKGLHIDISLLDNLVSLLGYYAGKYFTTGEIATPVGSHHPFIVPYGTYEAADGYLVLAVYTEEFWKKFVKAMNKEDWATDQRFATNESRVKNRELLISTIQHELSRKKVDEWVDIFNTHDIPHAPVLNIENALNHPQIKERNLIKDIHHPLYGDFSHVGTPIHYTNAPLNNNSAPPILGENTEEVLRNILNYSEEQIDRVKSVRVE